MSWSRVDTEYRIHRVQHTPSTPHTEYCLHDMLLHLKINYLPLPPSLSSLDRSCCTQFSPFPQFQISQWIESQLMSYLPHKLPPTYWPPPSTASIFPHYGLEVHLQSRMIIFSKGISKHTQIWLPNSLNHSLGVYLYVQSIALWRHSRTRMQTRYNWYHVAPCPVSKCNPWQRAILADAALGEGERIWCNTQPWWTKQIA